MSLDEPRSGQPMNRTILIGLAVAVVVVAAGVGAYFLMGGHSTSTSSMARKVIGSGDPLLVDAANAAAATEKGGICERSLARAQSYAIVPDTASVNGSETATQTDGRFTCAASANGQAFTLTVDKVCDNLSDHDCLMLQRVTTAGGATLFARR